MEKPSQGPQIEVKVVLFEAEFLSQAIDLFGLAHQSEAQLLDLLRCKRAGVDAPERLALQQFVQELDDSEDELTEPVLQTVRIQIQAARPGARLCDARG